MIIDEIRDCSISNRGRRILKLVCDKCDAEFDVVGGQVNVQKRRQHHFCSRKCAASSNERKDKIKSTCLSRYGVSNPNKLIEVQNKKNATCQERYGVDNPWKSKKIREKCIDTLKTKFGDEAFSSLVIQEKKQETCLERYGVENPMQSAAIQQKTRETCQERYGVDNPSKSKEIQTKMKETCVSRYGVENVWKVPSIHLKCNTHESRQKAYKTLRLNGTHGKSKAEDRFYEFILEKFPDKEVERHVMINGWCIDFKINNAYVQFDGIYWHGLDRSVEEIESSKSSRDTVILKTYMRDIEQKAWFEENKTLLCRISDKDFIHNQAGVYQKMKDFLL